MQTGVEHLMLNCRARSREIAFACALLSLAILVVAAGLFLRKSGWFHEDRNFAALPDGATGIADDRSGIGASNNGQPAASPEGSEGYFLVEESISGEKIKRNRQLRGDDFKRWTRYKVLDTYEMSGRLVAGLKESKSVTILIQPKGLQVPTAEQLREIAETFNSLEHHTTYAYFFLPGMEVKQNPWATVFQQANCPTSVSFDKTNVPELYRRFEDHVWK